MIHPIHTVPNTCDWVLMWFPDFGWMRCWGAWFFGRHAHPYKLPTRWKQL